MILEQALEKADKVILNLWDNRFGGYMQFQISVEDAKYNFANRDDDWNYCDLEEKDSVIPHEFEFVLHRKNKKGTKFLSIYTHAPKD